MAIAEPDFIDRDPAQITSEMIAQYEEASGKNSIRRRLSGCSLTCLLIVKTLSASLSRGSEAKPGRVFPCTDAGLFRRAGWRSPSARSGGKTTLQFSVTQAAKK